MKPAADLEEKKEEKINIVYLCLNYFFFPVLSKIASAMKTEPSNGIQCKGNICIFQISKRWHYQTIHVSIAESKRWPLAPNLLHTHTHTNSKYTMLTHTRKIVDIILNLIAHPNAHFGQFIRLSCHTIF